MCHGWFDLFVSVLWFSKQMETLLSLLTVPPESCSSRCPADSPQLSLGVRSISITVTWNDFTWCAERRLSGAAEVGSSTNKIHGGLRVLRAICWEFSAWGCEMVYPWWTAAKMTSMFWGMCMNAHKATYSSCLCCSPGGPCGPVCVCCHCCSSRHSAILFLCPKPEED